MKPCTGSSQICAYGYDPETRTLAVQFFANRIEKLPGPVYHIQEFPKLAFDDFDSAPSKGSHYAMHIRKGPFKVTRVDNTAKAMPDEKPSAG